jgi:hypothetical protein
MSKAMQEYILKDFMTRVNKLTVGRSTKDKFYGKVTCIKSADYGKGFNCYLNRTGYGTRKFSVSGSKIISNGAYTLGGLRKKLTGAIELYS